MINYRIVIQSPCDERWCQLMFIELERYDTIR